MKNTLRIFIAFCSCISIVSCAVPYAKKGTEGFMGGYEDKKLGTGHYFIEVEGNGYTSYEIAEQYFHRRASELCIQKQYKHKLKRTDTQHTEYYFTGATAGYTQFVFPVVVGEVWCEQ